MSRKAGGIIGQKNKRWCKNELEILRNNYGKVKIDKFLELLPNRTIQSVQKKAQKEKLKADYSLPYRIYTFDYDFFNELNIKTCYWAGLIGADGCISDENSLTFSFAIKDIEMLENFVKEIRFTGPIKEEIKSNRKKYCKLQIWGIMKWKEKLFEYFRITPRKSITLRSPLVNNELALAYIIGYFDGNGSWFISKRHRNTKSGRKISYRRELTFCGSKNMMKWIAGTLYEYENKSKYIHPRVSLNGESLDNFTIKYSCNRAIFIHNLLKTINIPWRLKRKWVD